MSPTAMSGESSASPNKMRYQQQKHSNHMKVGMDKKYPHLSQARLRSGKTFHSDDGSFLHPCSQYPHRASRVRSLSSTSLGPPSSPQQNSEPDPFGIQPCSAIHAPSFYQAFNRYSRALYLTRKENNIPIITAPLLFDLKGSLLDERHLKQLAKKGSLFEEMPSSCKDIRAALAQCLQESDCVMIQRNKPSDCLRPPLIDTMPTKCQQLKKGYGECKRGMVDMRKRFRGNQPIAVSKEIEGGAQNPSHQLYAGKAAFGSTAKETSGFEPEEKDWREVENEKYRKG